MRTVKVKINEQYSLHVTSGRDGDSYYIGHLQIVGFYSPLLINQRVCYIPDNINAVYNFTSGGLDSDEKTMYTISKNPKYATLIQYNITDDMIEHCMLSNNINSYIEIHEKV